MHHLGEELDCSKHPIKISSQILDLENCSRGLTTVKELLGVHMTPGDK